MSFFDWFWAAVAAALGWVAMPFIVIAALALIALVILVGAILWDKAERCVKRVKAAFK